MTKDLLIIGKGPAGVSAAIYAKRANLNLLVLGRDVGTLAKAERIENYYGLEAPLSGPALAARGISQLEALGVEVCDEEVVDLEYETHFQVTTKSGSYEAKALILATGAKRETPRIPGIAEWMGSGVSSCAVCDGFFFRGKDVAVLGSGPYALHEAEVLLPLAKSVTLLSEGKPLKALFPTEISVIEKKIEALYGESLLQGLRFTDDTQLSIQGLFLALGTAGAGELAQKLGVELNGSEVVIDADMRTSFPGLFAAGDCTGGLRQVATAVAQGSQAALSASAWLRGKR